MRQTTRDLMAQMEADLQTKLDWIAFDHYNTGHPHTHILVRGITDDGKILNIAGDYIAHGVRERASEILTLEMGRQTDLQVTDQLRREMHAERFTRLERMLMAEQRTNSAFADLGPDKDMLEAMKRNRALLISRAQYLEKLGLALKIAPGVWHLRENAEPALRATGDGRWANGAISSNRCIARWRRTTLRCSAGSCRSPYIGKICGKGPLVACSPRNSPSMSLAIGCRW